MKYRKKMRLNKSYIIYIFVFLLLISTLSLGADKNLQKDLDLAQRFILLDKYKEALEILKELRVKHPNNSTVLHRLKQVYLAQNDYANLIEVVQEELNNNPKSSALWLEAGDIYLSLDSIDKARGAFKKAIKFSENKTKYYKKIANKYKDKGYIDEGIKLVIKGRKKLGKKGAFALQLATFYEINRSYDKAIKEYVTYLEHHPDRYGRIRRRVRRIGKNEEQVKSIEEALKSALKDFDRNKFLYPLLAKLQMRLGEFKKAFSTYKKAEDLEDKNGKYIQDFADEVYKSGEYKIALRASEYMIEKASNKHKKDYARLIKAQSLQKLDKIEKAMNIYEQLAGSRYYKIAASSNLYLGEINLKRGYTDKAKQYLKKVTDDYPKASEFKDALSIYIEIFLKGNKIDKAKEYLQGLYEGLTEKSEGDALITYKLAQLDIIKGNYEDAQEYLNEILKKYMDSRYANEALEFLYEFGDILKEEENREVVSNLILLKETQQTSKFHNRVNSLIQKKKYSKLGDYLLFLSIKQYRESGLTKKALAQIEKLNKEFSESNYLPKTLEIKGDIYMDKGNYEKAQDVYKKIIMKHPKAINISRVRRKVGRLKGLVPDNKKG